MSRSRTRSPQRDRHRQLSLSHSPSHSHSPRGRHSHSSSPRRRHPQSQSRSCSSQRDASRSPTRSPSPPVIGRKRSCSSSEDGLHQLVKAQKVSEGGGRPKASDYDDVAKEVILCATAIYWCLVSTYNAFLTPAEEGELIKSAWNRANEETSQEVPIALTPVIAKVVSFLFILLY